MQLPQREERKFGSNYLWDAWRSEVVWESIALRTRFNRAHRISPKRGIIIQERTIGVASKTEIIERIERQRNRKIEERTRYCPSRKGKYLRWKDAAYRYQLRSHQIEWEFDTGDREIGESIGWK